MAAGLVCARAGDRDFRARAGQGGTPASIGRRAKWSPTTTASRFSRRSKTAAPAATPLMLDRLIHSFVVLDDPTALGYGYERAYADLTQMQFSGRQQIHTLFIGGGGYSLSAVYRGAYPVLR